MSAPLESQHRRVVARPGIAGSGLDDEYVMLDPGPGVYYGLNVVGTAVWHFIQRPRLPDEIVDHVCARFEVARDRCREDVAALVADLASRGLVEFVDDPVPTAPASDAR